MKWYVTLGAQQGSWAVVGVCRGGHMMKDEGVYVWFGNLCHSDLDVGRVLFH